MQKFACEDSTSFQSYCSKITNPLQDNLPGHSYGCCFPVYKG